MTEKVDTLFDKVPEVVKVDGPPPVTTKFVAFTGKYCKPDCYGFQIDGEYTTTTSYAGESTILFDMKLKSDPT